MAGRHHVVSKGYQRLVTGGKTIRLVSLDGAVDKPVSVRDAFVEEGFNTAYVSGEAIDDLEHEWARLENEVLPRIRAARDAGALRDSTPDVHALMALHAARSYSVQQLHRRVYEEAKRDARSELDLNRLRRAVSADTGKWPTEKELDRFIDDAIERVRASRVQFVESMVRVYNTILEHHISPFHLHVASVSPAVVRRGFELVISDNQVSRTGRRGLLVNVAFGDADQVFMPLGRDVLVGLSAKPIGDVDLAPVAVVLLNSLTWRGAHRFIGCHPEADWRRCLGRGT